MRRREPARRPVDEQCDEDEHGRGRKADRVHEHDRPERVVQRKHGVDPHDAHAAHAEERQDRRNERDAKAAQVAGQDLIRQAEDIRSEENEQAAVADLDDLRVVVENGQQILARQQHDHDGDGRGDDVLAEGQKHGFFAAVDLAGAVVLADKGRAGLTEGVEYVVGDDLDVERGARGGHDDGARGC